MGKFVVFLFIVTLLVVCSINSSSAWPFGNYDEKFAKMIDFLNDFLRNVTENDRKLRENMDQNWDNVEREFNKLARKVDACRCQ